MSRLDHELEHLKMRATISALIIGLTIGFYISSTLHLRFIKAKMADGYIMDKYGRFVPCTEVK